MTERSEEAFNQFIWNEYHHAQKDTRVVVADARNRDIGCVDSLTSTKGPWNPPGGGIFLDSDGYLKEWMETRRQVISTMGVHLFCGFMYVVEGLTTEKEQKNRIKDFQKEVNSLNKQLRTFHRVVVESNGSARPYMR